MGAKRLKVFSFKKLIVPGISTGFVLISTLWHQAIYSLFTVEQVTALVIASLFASAAFLITAAASAILAVKRFISGRITL